MSDAFEDSDFVLRLLVRGSLHRTWDLEHILNLLSRQSAKFGVSDILSVGLSNKRLHLRNLAISELGERKELFEGVGEKELHVVETCSQGCQL